MRKFYIKIKKHKLDGINASNIVENFINTLKLG